MGCSARSTTSFELNPITKGNQGTFICLFIYWNYYVYEVTSNILLPSLPTKLTTNQSPMIRVIQLGLHLEVTHMYDSNMSSTSYTAYQCPSTTSVSSSSIQELSKSHNTTLRPSSLHIPYTRMVHYVDKLFIYAIPMKMNCRITILSPTCVFTLWCVARSSCWGEISTFPTTLIWCKRSRQPGFCVKYPRCWSHDYLVSIASHCDIT